MGKRLVIGMSGASGAPLTVELLHQLHDRHPEVETHLIVTRGAELTLSQETGISMAQLKSLAKFCHSMLYNLKPDVRHSELEPFPISFRKGNQSEHFFSLKGANEAYNVFNFHTVSFRLSFRNHQDG